jgi:hypothetical protein
MRKCLREVLNARPHLRQFMYVTRSSDLYMKIRVAKDGDERKTNGLVLELTEGLVALHP